MFYQVWFGCMSRVHIEAPRVCVAQRVWVNTSCLRHSHSWFDTSQHCTALNLTGILRVFNMHDLRVSKMWSCGTFACMLGLISNEV